jgi:Flp pilus assembly protein TadG
MIIDPAARRRPPRNLGQSLVEMTFVLPLLATLMLAIVEFGWVYYSFASLNSAARIGARVGSTGSDQQAIANAVNSATGFLSGVNIVTSVEKPDGSSVSSSDRTTGNLLTVQVSVPYRAMTRLVDLKTIGGLSNLTAKNTFVICY